MNLIDIIMQLLREIYLVYSRPNKKCTSSNNIITTDETFSVEPL